MLATSEDASITILCLAWGGSALGHGQGGGSGERDVQSQWDGLGGVCVARRGVRRMRIQDGVLNQGFFFWVVRWVGVERKVCTYVDLYMVLYSHGGVWTRSAHNMYRYVQLTI